MISKELLSAVLEIEVTTVRDEIKSKANMLYFETTDLFTNRVASPCVPSINIYELAHRCKEHFRKTIENIDFMVYGSGQCDITIFGEPDDIKRNFNANTEIEAIFKTCEWILEKQNLKLENK